MEPIIRHPSSVIRHPSKDTRRTALPSLTALAPVAFMLLVVAPTDSFAQTAIGNMHPSHTPATGTVKSSHPHPDLRLGPGDPGYSGPGDPGSGSGNTGGGGSATLKVKGFDMDTYNHVATLLFSNGFKWVLDESRGTVTMSYKGSTHSYPMDEVFEKKSHGDEELKQQLEKRWRDALGVPEYQSRWVRLDPAQSDFVFQSRERRAAPIGSARMHPDLINVPTLPSVGVFGSYFRCNYPGSSCFYDSLPPSHGAPHGIFFVAPPYGSGGGSPEHHSANYKAWNRWRKDQCDSASGDLVHAAIAVGTFGATWKTALAGSEWGPPEWIGAGLLMAAEGVGIGWTYHEHNQHQANCSAPYPGKGNWP